MTEQILAKFGPSADCQYAIGDCHLPHTGLQLEHIVGIASLAVLAGITLIAISYRLLHR